MTPCSLAYRYQIRSYVRQSYNIHPTRRCKQQVAPKLWYHPPKCTASHCRWQNCYLLPWKPQNSHAADKLKPACRIWGWKSNWRNCCWLKCRGIPSCHFVIWLNKWKSFLKRQCMWVTQGISHLFMETECLLQSSQQLTTHSQCRLWKVPTKNMVDSWWWHRRWRCWPIQISIQIVKFTDSVWYVDTWQLLGLLSPFYMTWRRSWLTWWCVGCGRYRFGGVIP